MYRRLIFVLIFAILIAGVSSVVLYQVVIASVQNQPKTSNTKLLVAARDLNIGESITANDVKEIPWNGPAPANAIARIDAVVGRGAVAPIYAGEPISEGRLAQRGAGAGLAATIPVGKRAVALRVNEVVGLAGFVLPGMRVDVLIAGNAPSTTGASTGTLSRTVLQNIEVLSAGQRIDKDLSGRPEAAQVVNLLVTPEQAETLSLAGSEMKVQLVLRNPMDTREAQTPGTSVAKLFGEPEHPVAPTPAIVRQRPRPVVTVAPTPVPEPPIEIFSGAKRTVGLNGEGK